MSQNPTEEDILMEAHRITGGDRNEDYGDPSEEFARVSNLWNSMLNTDIIEPRHVPMMMILLKVSREMNKPKRDNAVDMAGYARCLDLCNTGKAATHE